VGNQFRFKDELLWIMAQPSIC